MPRVIVSTNAEVDLPRLLKSSGCDENQSVEIYEKSDGKLRLYQQKEQPPGDGWKLSRRMVICRQSP